MTRFTISFGPICGLLLAIFLALPGLSSAALPLSAVAGNTVPGTTDYVGIGRVGAVTLNTGESNLSCVVLDPARGHGYFATDTVAGRVVKVGLGDGAAAPTRLSVMAADTSEGDFVAAAVDLESGYAYFILRF